jgi:hypothetical protein
MNVQGAGWLANVSAGRFWKSVKYEEIYLSAHVGDYIVFASTDR